MSLSRASGPPRAAAPPVPAPVPTSIAASVDTRRRRLQLALAAIWLFDGVLQLQPFMFTRQFAATVMVPAADGNPPVVADPISWAARIVGDHSVGANLLFAAIQVGLGLAIAWRPALRVGLAASVLWSLGVWWFGEGFGGLLTGGADPVSGAPGAVVLYALAAILLWPTARDAPFPAAGFTGARPARAVWAVLWGGLAALALQSANTQPQATHDMIASMAQGEPGWLAAAQNQAASLLAGKGLATAVVLAAVLAAVATAPYLRSPRAIEALLVLGIIAAALIWVIGEAAGGLLLGTGTDPNSGPLLVLLALAFWPPGAEVRTPRSQHSGTTSADSELAPPLPRETVDTGSLGGTS
jgi:hypothetical protein